MKDVEYCSSIIILAREGIIDQTRSEKIDLVYDDLKEFRPYLGSSILDTSVKY
ncbi:hypothetical protein [Denitrovibrio acetiphilus]|uniref:hypothetical protein n=1 Tax=Denitrovibrio acetiphilus TaxID=118000 RepID=UPI00019B468F|nr:hypothetical protein [Denitrovibrio acetiphilus]